MKTYSLKVGSVVFWANWLWVVERRINASWRLQRLGDRFVTLLEHSQMSEALSTNRLFILTEQQHSPLLSLDMAAIRQLVSQLSRQLIPIEQELPWVTSISPPA